MSTISYWWAFFRLYGNGPLKSLSKAAQMRLGFRARLHPRYWT